MLAELDDMISILLSKEKKRFNAGDLEGDYYTKFSLYSNKRMRKKMIV